MDAELDKGYIIAQEIINDCDENETLSGSYYELDRVAKSLFKRVFCYYKFWPSIKKICLGKGSYHSLKDGASIKALIDTYDISIAEFRTRLGGINSHES